jgi:hypothetical protein
MIYRFSLICFFIAFQAFAQAPADAYPTFKQEFETYRDSPQVSSENSTIKPGPCGQYNLKYMVTIKGTAELPTTPPARKLCYDINRFDKSKNPDAPADWIYDIKPIGDQYYVISASKNGQLQEVYYYTRNPKKS